MPLLVLYTRSSPPTTLTGLCLNLGKTRRAIGVAAARNGDTKAMADTMRLVVALLALTTTAFIRPHKELVLGPCLLLV